jgi:5-methylcytosine-specific restriction protein A
MWDHTRSPTRLRGRALQRRNARVLREQPLCRRCAAQGRTTAATQVDHIVALARGGTDDHDNLQGLCSECHGIKTVEDRTGVVRGCAVDGMPSDPAHPWNRE